MASRGRVKTPPLDFGIYIRYGYEIFRRAYIRVTRALIIKLLISTERTQSELIKIFPPKKTS